jgi:hypothetical protein
VDCPWSGLLAGKWRPRVNGSEAKAWYNEDSPGRNRSETDGAWIAVPSCTRHQQRCNPYETLHKTLHTRCNAHGTLVRAKPTTRNTCARHRHSPLTQQRNPHERLKLTIQEALGGLSFFQGQPHCVKRPLERRLGCALHHRQHIAVIG